MSCLNEERQRARRKEKEEGEQVGQSEFHTGHQGTRIHKLCGLMGKSPNLAKSWFLLESNKKVWIRYTVILSQKFTQRVHFFFSCQFDGFLKQWHLFFALLEYSLCHSHATLQRKPESQQFLLPSSEIESDGSPAFHGQLLSALLSPALLWLIAKPRLHFTVVGKLGSEKGKTNWIISFLPPRVFLRA